MDVESGFIGVVCTPPLQLQWGHVLLDVERFSLLLMPQT